MFKKYSPKGVMILFLSACFLTGCAIGVTPEDTNKATQSPILKQEGPIRFGNITLKKSTTETTNVSSTKATKKGYVGEGMEEGEFKPNKAGACTDRQLQDGCFDMSKGHVKVCDCPDEALGDGNQ